MSLFNSAPEGSPWTVGKVDPSLTIKFTGTKTISTIVPKISTKIISITQPTPKTVKKTTTTTTPTTKTTTVPTIPGKTTTVNLIPDKGITGPPKLLTEKAFAFRINGGRLVESPVSGKLIPDLQALNLVNPDLIGWLSRPSAQCIIDNAPGWVTYRYNGTSDKLQPLPSGEPIEVGDNEGLVVAVRNGEGCNLEGVFTPKPKSNPLQLNNKGWNLYAMQPELEGKKITSLQCPSGTRVTEAYNLRSGEWTEITDFIFGAGKETIWWTQSVFVRCD